MDRRVTALDFDGSIRSQLPYMGADADVVTLTDLSGCRLACQPETQARIRARLKGHALDGVVLLGSGDYHYLTRLLLERFESPFSLVLFDNHPELLEPPLLGDLWACSSWLALAMDDLPNLRQAVLVGVDPEAFLSVPSNRLVRTTFLPIEPIPPGIRRRLEESQREEFLLRPLRQTGWPGAMTDLLERIETESIYISVDKDVLAEGQATTNWNQGRMTARELVEAVASLARSRILVGMDICGEVSASPVDLLRPEVREAIRTNMRVNSTLLAAVGVQ